MALEASLEASLERELRRMEILARREQLRLSGRSVPRAVERRRSEDTERGRADPR